MATTLENILQRPAAKNVSRPAAAVPQSAEETQLHGKDGLSGPATDLPSAAASQDGRPVAPQPGTGAAPRRMRMSEIYERLNPDPRPTPEEQERERKARRRDQIFSAIGDGISALSNLYFTTRYAPNSPSPSPSFSARSRERWQQLDAQRAANRQAYVKGKMAAYQADDEADRVWTKIRNDFDLGNRKQDEAERHNKEGEKLKKEKQDNDYKLGRDRLGETARHNKAAEELGRKRLGETARHNKAAEDLGRKRLDMDREEKRKGRTVTLTLQTPDGNTADVKIPKEKWNRANISKLYWLLGGKDIRENGGYGPAKLRKPTTEEMEQYIGRNLMIGNPRNARRVENALKELEGMAEE